MNSKPASTNVIKDIYPLSPMQEGMLFHSLQGGDDYFYQISYRLNGKLDIVLVEKSFQHLVNRYDVFRTIFRYANYERPLQIVLNTREGSFIYGDIREDVHELGRVRAVERRRLSDKEQKFKLSEEVPMRINIYRTGEEDYEFLWSFHHILMDGWGLSIIVNEFNALYTGYRDNRKVHLPATQPYSSYIRWLEERDKEKTLNYWRDYLSGYESQTTIPKDGYPSTPVPFVPAVECLVLDKQMTESLKQMGSKHGVTLNTILQGAWGILLSRYNNTTDVVFGSVVSGRPAELPGIELMVGLFINTIPVRISYEEQNSIIDVLKQVQAKAVEGESHHYHPLSEIQSVSGLGAALMDHIIVFENYPIARKIEEGIKDEKETYTVTDFKMFEHTNYDLTLVVSPGEGTCIEFKYNSNRYESAIITRMIGHFYQIIHQINTNIDRPVKEIDVLSAPERQQLLHGFNDTQVEYPKDRTIIDLFEEQVRKTPDQTAVIHLSRRLSYRELDDKSSHMANELAALGVKQGQLVGILQEPSELLLVSVLGILKAGAAFVPIDKDYPESRKRHIVEHSGLSVLVSTEKLLADNHAILATIAPEKLVDITVIGSGTTGGGQDLPKVSTGDLAYVLYTSGSTGQPKGVMINHASLFNYLSWANDTYVRGKECTMALFSSISFDLTITSLFLPLINGNSLHVYEQEAPSTLIERVVSEGRINVLKLTPSHLKILNESRVDISGIRCLIVGGEPFDTELAASINDRGSDSLEIYNEYGPTEATVGCVIHRWDRKAPALRSSVLIGRPVPNTQIYILDNQLNLLPQGVIGEIYIGGAQLFSGYISSPNETRERLITNPFIPGEKIYRTGDRARLLSNGEIEFIGRLDDQVKIRGYRIELGEIENQLSSHPGIKEAVVLAREREGEQYLAGYFVSEFEIPAAELNDYLSRALPEYMLPAYYFHVDSIPLTANGKTDRKRLPESEFTAGEEYVAPADEQEEQLIAIWSEVLQLEKEKISVNASFFSLGGHSIRAIRLIRKIQDVFSVSLDMRDVLRENTISGISSLIKNASLIVKSRIPKAEKKEYYLTSPAQERMYYDYLLDINSTRRNNTSAVELGEDINVRRLEEAFQALIERHVALRTCFELTNGILIQKTLPKLRFELKTLIISHDVDLKESSREFKQPFDLSNAPLIRAAVVSSPDRNYLFIDIHHIICDGTSVNILTRDLRDLYFGKTLPALELDYVDFAEWVRKGIENEQTHKNYWLKKLSGNLSRLNLPVLQNEELVKDNAASEIITFIDSGLYKKIKQFSTEADVTDFMFFLSVYFIMINRITGDQDIIIGTDGIGRNSKQLDGIVGTFINILPLRMDIDGGRRYTHFLNEVKECVLSAFEHQEYPYDKIVSLVSSDVNPLIDMHFSFANAFDSNRELDELQFKRILIEGSATDGRRAEYHIELSIGEHEEQFQLSFIYNSSLYDESTIQFFIEIYLNVLKTVISNETIELDHITIGSGISIY